MTVIKRSAALFLLLLILCGCAMPDVTDMDIKDYFTASALEESEYTEENSAVEFAVYPDGCECFGKFERSAYLSLNERERKIYLALDDAVFNMTEGDVLLGDATYSEIDKAYFALRNDRPEYFWFPSVYSLKSTANRSYISFTENGEKWLYTKEERSEKETLIKSAVTEFYNSAKNIGNEFERELSAHDFVVDNVTYDKEAQNDTAAFKDAWNICGAFLGKKAVCTGYSKAFQLLLFSLGINCTTVSGVAGEPHIWNCVNINHEWYYCDLTADDTEDNGYKSFFNVNAEMIADSRTVYPAVEKASDKEISSGEYNIFLPLCFSTDQNYFKVNSRYAENKDQLCDIVTSSVLAAVNDGKNEVEIFTDPKVGFVFGKTDISGVIDLTACLKDVNRNLSFEKRIKKYSVSGINGVHSFIITW